MLPVVSPPMVRVWFSVVWTNPAASSVRFPDTVAKPLIVVSPVVASTENVADEVLVPPTKIEYQF